MTWTFIGVDAGGTSTCAVHISRDGTVLNARSSGPANPYVGFEESVNILAALIDEVRSDETRVSITIALSGGDSVTVCDRHERQLSRMLRFPHVIQVVHDSFAPAALLLPSFDMERVSREQVRVGVLIAGTGSMALMAAPVVRDGIHAQDGAVSSPPLQLIRRSGGWGPVVSDKGSAFFVATHAISLSLEVFDGMASESTEDAMTLLHQAQIHFCGTMSSHIDGLLMLVDKLERLNRSEVAGFADNICKLAAVGNCVANCTLRKAGEELGKLLKGVLQDLGELNCASFVATGGLFAAWDIENSSMQKGLLESMVGAREQWNLARAQISSPAESGINSAIVKLAKEVGLNASAMGAARLSAITVRERDAFMGLMKYVRLEVIACSDDCAQERTIS